MTIGPKTVVSIEYTLKDDAGEVLDTSNGREPLIYLHGVGNLVPGLERALDGRAKGDSIEVTWPDGTTSRRDQVKANQIVEIKK